MKNFLKNQDNLIILFVSFVAFIAGCLAKHPILSILMIAIADLFFFYPEISAIIKRKGSKKMKKADNEISKKLENAKKKVRKLKNEKNTRKKILLIILTLFIIFISVVILFAAYIVISAPKFDPEQLYAAEPSTLYDINGDEIAKLGTEKRENITYDQIPEVLVDAIVATEDSKFFQHNGFDLSRFVVASFKQVLTRGGGGASTLTMQVVKNTFTSTTSSGFEGIKRKFTDIYMSVFQVEKNYTKKEILEFYVNSYYLGSGAYGVEQASYNYFGKSAKDMNLAEAALVAGLFQAPNAYDPYQHPDKAEQRRNQVLKLMKRHNYITKDEYDAAIAIKVEDMLVNSTEEGASNSNEWQAFVDTVVEEVVDDTGMDPYQVSMKIYTTLDKEKQSVINDIMNGTTYKWQNDYVDAGIVVQDVKTGAIVAVGAGRNRVGERQYNTATMINRQIGSTSKPLFDYAPGIEYENWSTYKLFVDEPYSYSDGTEINNWDRKYNGLMTLRSALAQSRNIPALKAFQENKNSNILKFVKSVGLHPEVSDNGIIHEAHSIGGYTGESPKNMAAAYSVFGNGGYYITPHSYTKVVINETKEEIEKKVEKTRVLSEETSYMMSSLLQSAAQYGLGNQANVGGAVYGAKTGTSNFDAATIKRYGFGDNVVNDLWVDGVSPDYAISVWYGYKSRTAENAKYYSTSYTVAHRTLFQAVAKGVFKKGSNWTKPNGVVEVRVEMGTWPAALASEYTPESNVVTELFKAGTEPTSTSSKYSKLPDPTGLKGSISDNVLTLSWNAVTATNTSQLGSLYKSGRDDSLGSIIYKVYGKDSNGNLSFIKDVDGTSTTINVNTESPTTYVVKAAYASYSATASDGASVTISLANVKANIEVKLNVSESTEVALNSPVAVSKNDVQVLADGKDVTSKADITFNNIDTSSAGTYSVTYTIKYNGNTYTKKRTITVK